jgi:hypothetical protein
VDAIVTIKRSEFGLDAFFGSDSDEVKVDIAVEALKAQRPGGTSSVRRRRAAAHLRGRSTSPLDRQMRLAFSKRGAKSDLGFACPLSTLEILYSLSSPSLRRAFPSGSWRASSSHPSLCPLPCS